MRIPEYSEMTAVLTGSSGGIALASAVALARAGVPRIMLNGRTAETCRQAADRLRKEVAGVEVDFVAADVTKADDAERLIQETVHRFKSIELLVNSVAGPAPPQLFHKVSRDSFDDQIRAHLLSVLNVTHAALPHMMAGEGGTIINIASDAGKVATPGEAVIGGLKAAVGMFSRTLALEASRSGIRVHCLMPSLVRNTATYDRVMSEEFSRKLFEKAAARAKLGVAEPEDIAGLIVYLAGPSAARITGQTVSINGGLSVA